MELKAHFATRPPGCPGFGNPLRGVCNLHRSDATDTASRAGSFPVHRIEQRVNEFRRTVARKHRSKVSCRKVASSESGTVPSECLMTLEDDSQGGDVVRSGGVVRPQPESVRSEAGRLVTAQIDPVVRAVRIQQQAATIHPRLGIPRSSVLPADGDRPRRFFQRLRAGNRPLGNIPQLHRFIPSRRRS